ncbi:MAG: radical SAM protein, partial [Anaerolineae bacterium]
PNRFMSSLTRNYLINVGKLVRNDRLLRPVAVAYYATTQCNLTCAYCEDFGQRRNNDATPPLPAEDALRVLRTIRSGTDHLILTGGDPLLYPHIVPLALRARRELKFRHITLQTNGLLLPQCEELLAVIDRLVISLDSTDPVLWSSITGVPVGVVAAILDNVRVYAGRQREFGYQLVANCVISPETLPGARQVLDFCAQNEILISVSPQSVNNWPRYELLVSENYQSFLRELIARKRSGAPILGSTAYLRTLLDLRSFSCYPLLVPRVLPDGALIYPCRPIEKADNGQGGRSVNLLEAGSWTRALRAAAERYGLPPRVCTSCFQQCYIEPSLMQARSLSWAGEWLRHRASRHGRLTSFAPG